jgi:hypothetical protein
VEDGSRLSLAVNTAATTDTAATSKATVTRNQRWKGLRIDMQPRDVPRSPAGTPGRANRSGAYLCGAELDDCFE